LPPHLGITIGPTLRSPPCRLALVAAVLAAALVAAAPASASPTQISIVQDEGRLLDRGAQAQAQALDEIKALGADAVKVTVNWRSLAPSGSHKPSGFLGDDPSQYNPANWSMYDSLVRGAAIRGLRVMFLVGGRAPDWAAGARKAPAGSYRPSAVEFGRFVKALGTRYSGTYNPAAAPGGAPPPPGSGTAQCATPAPPGDPCPNPIPASAAFSHPVAPTGFAADDSGALPRVDLWAVWNEPNLSGWLQPQYTRKKTPVSPQIYRGLFLAAHDGLVASGHEKDEILMGDLLPFARSGKTYPARVSPIKFLRELACVNNRYRAYRGAAASARGCTNYKPLPGTGIAYHPYTLAQGPEALTPLADDATINDLTRLDRALRKLARRFVDHKMPIWITEFGYQTDPPDPFASPVALVPRFMSESEWLAYHDQRVKSYAQYPLSDDSTAGRGLARFHGFQSGIDSSSNRHKKFVYQAFQTPLFVRLVSRSRLEIFGGVRVADGGTAVLQTALGKSRKFRTFATVKLNSRGYFDRNFRVGRAANRSFRLLYQTERSNLARPFKRPRAGTLYPRRAPRHR
jgi:hypothetical protein